ncbi:MAG: tetratricopeptide repeat protein [Boseongicola sp. SB0665_bin_10]|nr:tetratricopeptide repeat protein [Boseongicola sp. SB0665_bin_10]
MFREALAIAEAAFGEHHPIVASRLNNLAGLLHDTNRNEDAEPLLRRALDILDSSSANAKHEHPRLELLKANYQTILRAMADERD